MNIGRGGQRHDTGQQGLFTIISVVVVRAAQVRRQMQVQSSQAVAVGTGSAVCKPATISLGLATPRSARVCEWPRGFMKRQAAVTMNEHVDLEASVQVVMSSDELPGENTSRGNLQPILRGSEAWRKKRQQEISAKRTISFSDGTVGRGNKSSCDLCAVRWDHARGGDD